MNFWRAVEVLDKRKWLILLSALVTAALTLGATRLIGSLWVASVRFVSEPTAAQTELEYQRGRPQMLDPEARYAKAQATVYENIVRSAKVIEPAIAQSGERLTQSQFANNIRFRATGSRTFVLEVLDTSPIRAAKLANALAEHLERENKELHTAQGAKVVEVLKNNLAQAEAALANTRRRYEQFRKERNVMGSQNDDMGLALARLQSARQKRDELNLKLAEARARLAETERELARLPKTIEMSQPPTPTPLIQELERQLAAAESNLTSLRTRYTDDVIEVKRAVAQRDALKRYLEAEKAKLPPPVTSYPNPAAAPLQQAIAQLRTEIKGHEANLSALNATYAAAESDIDNSRELEGPLGALARQIAQQTEIRENLAARLQTARMALDEAKARSPLFILDKVGPLNPPVNTKPGRTAKLMLMAVLCALLLTSGAVIALESIDRRVKTVQDAELQLPAPVCAAIPQPLGNVTRAALPRVTELHPLSLNSEAYRFLALHLLNANARGLRSLMVLSAKAEQGSTNTVTNLGITLAQAGHRVIIVDANVRTPELHAVMGLDNTLGLTDLLKDPDATPLEDALHSTSVEGLRVITSGPAPENPWQLFRSESLKRLSRRLQEMADYVIYDTPSALAFTDALNLTPVVDAAVLCVRALEQPSGAERKLIESLKLANVEILGVVLSDVPAPLLESYQNYQRYYPGSDRAIAPLNGNGSPSALPAVGALADANGNKNGSAVMELGGSTEKDQSNII